MLHRFRGLLVLAVLAPLGAGATGWVERTPTDAGTNGAPAPRSGAQLAYFPNVGQVALFGGELGDGGLLGDTWLWNGTAWTPFNSSASVSPSARAEHNLITDPSGNVLLFGGNTSVGGNNETWELQGDAGNATGWIQLTTPTGLAARYLAAATADPDDHQALLFGGTDSSGVPLPVAPIVTIDGDLWSWDAGAGWQQLSDAGPAGYGAAMTYDTTNHEAVLFGGRDSSLTVTGAIWTWSPVQGWTGPQSTSGGCLPRDFHAMAYFPPTASSVIFGGLDADAGLLGDTCVWNGAWTSGTPQPSPSPRDLPAMAYDPSRQVIVLFGGKGAAGTLGDVWEYSTAVDGGQVLGGGDGGLDGGADAGFPLDHLHGNVGGCSCGARPGNSSELTALLVLLALGAQRLRVRARGPRG